MRPCRPVLFFFPKFRLDYLTDLLNFFFGHLKTSSAFEDSIFYGYVPQSPFYSVIFFQPLSEHKSRNFDLNMLHLY